MEISLMIETSKTSVKVYTNSNDVKTQYNAVLNCIQELQLATDEEDNSEEIATLDNVLDLLGQLLLVAEEEF